MNLMKYFNLNLFKRILNLILFKYYLNNFKNNFQIISNIDNFFIHDQFLKKKNSYKIAFITPPNMNAHSGGSTSILRLGSYLAKFGHEIYYICYGNDKKKEMESKAKNNFINYKGTFLERKDISNNKFDIGISTNWISCYHLIAFQDFFDYKMYFIQDFEPYFYSIGDYYYLALNTYKFGFHMVSLGSWNKVQIEKITLRKVDYIDFPVEINEYKLIKRKIKIKNEIKMAIYLKYEDKRAPFLIIQQLEYLKSKLIELGYKVELNVFGIDKLIKIPEINNLGKLNKSELRKLYKNSHFGLVASLTNISLVNYEMIASGLPVIDFIDGSAHSFFHDDEMIFIKSDFKDLFEKVFYYVNNQDKLNEIIQNSQNRFIKENKSWEKTASQFNDIVLNSAE